MLYIKLLATEQYDEVNDKFFTSKEQTLCLEHSLVSISKWESKWLKPFLSKVDKTIDETIDYIRCMTITKNVDHDIFNLISNDNIKQVRDYIEAAMTATTFHNENKTTNREIITAEIIYYWMISMNIPFECQKWHLNRLLTLINVCGVKNQSPKKRSKKELMSRNAALNASRRESLGTKG